MLTTISKSFDRFVFIATTSSSITLSLTAIKLIVIPISDAAACGLSIVKKVVYEIVMKSKVNTKDKMRKINKQLNAFRKYIEKFAR